MKKYQDIREFEDRINDALEEMTYNAEAFDHPTLHIYLDDDKDYQAELIDTDQEGEDYYNATDYIREGEDGSDEVDFEAVSELANSYIFIR